MERKRGRKIKWLIFAGIALLTVVLNVIAWNSTAFCDAYITWVFPFWINTYGRLTGLFPFSVGEWLLVAAVLLVAAAIFLGICSLAVMVICGIRKLCTQGAVSGGEKHGWWYFVRKFYGFFAWILLTVCLIMTLNCTILYHASPFSQKYFGGDTGEEYSPEELIRVYNLVAGECNRLSGEMPRDAEGKIVWDEAALSREAKACLQKLGQKYSQLEGWYPDPKPMMFSDFMCQQYMCGYYFPFSLEANYNDVMYLPNKPSAFCHELAHLRGYIFEDEANFIAYLACLESEDDFFRYSGYLSVINYLANDLYRALQEEPEAVLAAAQKVPPLAILPQVREDNIFVEQKEWDRIHEKAWFDTEKVDELSDTFTDTTLKANGVSDGMISYSRVVRLLMLYYCE